MFVLAKTSYEILLRSRQSTFAFWRHANVRYDFLLSLYLSVCVICCKLRSFLWACTASGAFRGITDKRHNMASLASWMATERHQSFKPKRTQSYFTTFQRNLPADTHTDTLTSGPHHFQFTFFFFACFEFS